MNFDKYIVQTYIEDDYLIMDEYKNVYQTLIADLFSRELKVHDIKAFEFSTNKASLQFRDLIEEKIRIGYSSLLTPYLLDLLYNVVELWEDYTLAYDDMDYFVTIVMSIFNKNILTYESLDVRDYIFEPFIEEKLNIKDFDSYDYGIYRKGVDIVEFLYHLSSGDFNIRQYQYYDFQGEPLYHNTSENIQTLVRSVYREIT